MSQGLQMRSHCFSGTVVAALRPAPLRGERSHPIEYMYRGPIDTHTHMEGSMLVIHSLTESQWLRFIGLARLGPRRRMQGRQSGFRIGLVYSQQCRLGPFFKNLEVFIIDE
jgi:hypothetical protein